MFEDEDDLNYFSGMIEAEPDLSFTAPEFSYATDTTDRDLSQGFGVSTDTPLSRNHDLIESENSIHLENYKKLMERFASPNYQLTPSQAFAATALSILPSALGYAYGGNEGAAGAAQASGGGVQLIKNFQDADAQQREAAKQAAGAELDLYKLDRQEQIRRADKIDDREFQRAAKLDDRDFQREMQNGRLDVQMQAQQNANARNDATNARIEGDRARRIASFNIPGLEVIPGREVRDVDYKEAAELKQNGNRLMVNLNRLKDVFSNPESTIEDQRTAAASVVNAIKKVENYGASFSGLEADLAKGGLPPIADITDLSAASNAVLSSFRGADPIKKIDDLIAHSKMELAAQLEARKYRFPESSSVDTSMYDPVTQAQIQIESSGNPAAVSPRGAQGLMQLTPAAITDVANMLGMDPQQAIEKAKSNPRFNVFAGQMYQGMMVDRNGGDILNGAAAYNAGQGNVNKYGGTPPFEETQNYVKKMAKAAIVPNPDGQTGTYTDPATGQTGNYIRTNGGWKRVN